MPLYILILTLDIVFAVHAVRRGHSLTWIFIILIFPVIGAIVYFIAMVLPELQNSRAARQFKNHLKTITSTETHKSGGWQPHEVTDILDRKIKHAQALINKHSTDEAIQYLLNSLQGHYTQNPQLLLLLANAYFITGEYIKTIETLDRIMQHNPEFRSQDGHLLYARALEQSGNAQKALDEYKALSQYYIGYEAKCRYALLLKQFGQVEIANHLFQEVIQSARFANQSERTQNSEWVTFAREELE